MFDKKGSDNSRNVLDKMVIESIEPLKFVDINIVCVKKPC